MQASKKFFIGQCLSFLIAFVPLHSAEKTKASEKLPNTLYSLVLRSIDEKPVHFDTYLSKVLLIVNTASRCGFTKQYAALQKLQERFGSQGFSVLGFPSNDFAQQEPGSNAEIKLFCQKKYQVNFPLFAKAAVGGEEIQPLYAWLLSHSARSEPIAWNFEKFLISKDGKVLKRFASITEPESPELLKEIEAALKLP